MNRPGSLSIERNHVRWSSSLSGSYLSVAAVGVLAGIGVAYARTPIHLPGHKILLWMVPVLVARILTRTRGGASTGALTTAITVLILGGQLAGGIALLPLIVLAGAVLDAATDFVQRNQSPCLQRILMLGAAGAIGNMICFVKRFFDPIGSIFSTTNVRELLIAAGSHAVFGFVAGLLGAVAGVTLLREMERVPHSRTARSSKR